eukprot:3530879-Karenia_brevis.AAC.1
MPWQLDPSIGEAVPIQANIIPIVPTADLPLEPKPRGEEDLPRGVHLRKDVELRQYGFTSGCPGCVAALKGARPVNHSPKCRAGILEAMRAAKDPRLTADKSAVEDIRRGTQLNEPAATPASGAP